jgi:mRNA-degrading endonuclease toxin of MazEF toxin-antitoxin module
MSANTPDPLDITLANLKVAIKRQPQKQQRLLNEWLEKWGKYLTFESLFDPKRLVYYKRGDIVLVHFGYNVGNEQGGVHYAVVVENENSLSSGIVMVVPLSSLDAGKTIADLHKSEVFLGQLIGGIDCYAMPLQMRTVSKLRIIKPKHKTQSKVTVPGNLLDKIDEQIRLNFTKQNT